MFAIPKKRIAMPTEDNQDNGFDVRGLSTEDLVALISKYFAELKPLFDPNADRETLNFESIITDLQKKAPMALAEGLAIAADMPDQVAVFAKLPTYLQYSVASEIGVMTFGQEGGLESFLELLIKTISDVTVVMNHSQKVITEMQLARASVSSTTAIPSSNGAKNS